MQKSVQTNAGHWQDWLNLVLGIWLFATPWILQYGAQSVPAWNGYLFGTIVAVLSIAAIIEFARWEEWSNLVVGAWLIISPWALGFSEMTVATWNHVIVGLLVAGLAGWELQLTQRGEPTRA